MTAHARTVCHPHLYFATRQSRVRGRSLSDRRFKPTCDAATEKMQTFLRHFFALLTAFLAAGCVPNYKAPSHTDQTAQLRFATHVRVGIMNISAFVHDSHQSFCEKNRSERQSIGHMNGIAIDHNRQTLSMPLGEIFAPEAKTEIVVEANKRFYYTLGYESDSVCIASAGVCTGSSRCIVRGSFIPSTGKMYEIAYDIEGNTCVTTTSQITSDGFSGYFRRHEPSVIPYELSCPPTSKP